MIDVVTVATEPHEGFQLFAASCATHGIAPNVIEQGSEWRGFAWRFKAVIRYLRTLNSEFVLHSDCFDAIALAPLEVAQEKFDALDHPWVFSWQPDLLGRPEPFLNLCAGLWMGRREYILETITDAWLDALFPDHFNDEFQLQLMLARLPGLFGIDANSTLFYSSSDLNPVVGPAWMHCIVQG